MAKLIEFDLCAKAERELYDLLYEFYDICAHPGDYDMSTKSRRSHRRALKFKISVKLFELYPLRLLRDAAKPDVISLVSGMRRDA